MDGWMGGWKGYKEGQGRRGKERVSVSVCVCNKSVRIYVKYMHIRLSGSKAAGPSL